MQPHGRGERQKTVAAVGREFFIPYVRSHPSRQIFHIGKRMDTYPLITNAKAVSPQFHIFQRGGVLQRKGEVFLHEAGLIRRSGNFIVRQPFYGNKPRIVHDAFKLADGFQKLGRRVLIHLFGDNMTPAEGGEIRLHPHPFLGGLGDIQVARMVQERTLVKVAFVTAG